MNRRHADSPVLWIVGVLLIGAGLALKIWSDASDVLVITLVLIGGVMVPGSRVVDLVRAWRRNGGNDAAVPPQNDHPEIGNE